MSVLINKDACKCEMEYAPYLLDCCNEIVHSSEQAKTHLVRFYFKNKRVTDLEGNLIGYGEWDSSKNELKVIPKRKYVKKRINETV